MHLKSMNNCCPQCCGRQGTSAGGGVFCNHIDCFCHRAITPQPVKEEKPKECLVGCHECHKPAYAPISYIQDGIFIGKDLCKEHFDRFYKEKKSEHCEKCDWTEGNRKFQAT